MTSFVLTLFTVWTVSQYVTVRKQVVIIWKGAWDFQQVFVFGKLVGFYFEREIHCFYMNCIQYWYLLNCYRLIKITVKFVFEKYLLTPFKQKMLFFCIFDNIFRNNRAVAKRNNVDTSG